MNVIDNVTRAKLDALLVDYNRMYDENRAYSENLCNKPDDLLNFIYLHKETSWCRVPLAVAWHKWLTSAFHIIATANGNGSPELDIHLQIALGNLSGNRDKSFEVLAEAYYRPSLLVVYPEAADDYIGEYQGALGDKLKQLDLMFKITMSNTAKSGKVSTC